MKTFKIFLFTLIMFGCSQKTIFSILKPEKKISVMIIGVPGKRPVSLVEDDRSQETEEWVVEQNKLTYSYLEKIPFRDRLRERLTELMNYPKYGYPQKINNKYYFYKNDGLQNQSVLYELDSLTAEPTVLLDPNKLSTDGTIALSRASFSKDGKYLAYSISKSGSDWNEIL